VQEAERAAFPPGEAKEDWAILRALSDVLGKRLPYDNREALRAAIVAQAPHFAVLDKAPVHAAADPAIWNAVGVAGPVDSTLPLGSAMTDYYLTKPHRAGQPHDGRMQPRARPRRALDGGGVSDDLRPLPPAPRTALRLGVDDQPGRDHRDFPGGAAGFDCLLDSRRPQDLGGGADAARPQCRGAFGLLQTFADAFKFMFKESIIRPGQTR